MSKFTIHKEVQTTMNYTLNKNSEEKNKTWQSVKRLFPMLDGEKKNLIISSIAIFINSVLNLLAPFLIGYAIDAYIQTKDYSGVYLFGVLLLGIYLLILVASYVQTRVMGGVAQRLIFKLRSAIFLKLQELPIAFFNQNKAGDLISRINSDTEKLNEFFSRSFMQLIGSVFVMIGAGIFLLFINIELGAVTLLPAFILITLTQILTPWVKKANKRNLQSTGGMSGEIQESLTNFKVIIAFNRRDYFRKRFNEVNDENFKTGISAGIANNIFAPLYSLAYNIAQLVVLVFGIYLIMHGSFTVGFLISFFTFTTRFYDPLRQVAALWTSLQVALAGWDRISEILALESDLPKTLQDDVKHEKHLLEFEHVHFGYPDGEEILSDICIQLEEGKTYALVGPTGGGKTTTASLMARLYDPTKGTVYLDGKDIRTYDPMERSKMIGFILQEPFLFTGTVGENIVYGNEEYEKYSMEQLKNLLDETGLLPLLSQFQDGLETKVSLSADTISLGQRQLIAFIRAVLRRPKLLILDEATANIDTITEQLLEEVLQKLPKETTRVIIAHRLNTIENADEIFFVNSGGLTQAHSLREAVDMLLHGKRES